jgi:hypothetical protein
MRPFPLVRLRGLLQAERQFAVALPEAERMHGLNRRFASVVPPAVARACWVAALQGEVALIYCANGAAASRVRAQAKGVASVLSRSDAPVSSIKVKVRADWSLPMPAEKNGYSNGRHQCLQSVGNAFARGRSENRLGTSHQPTSAALSPAGSVRLQFRHDSKQQYFSGRPDGFGQDDCRQNSGTSSRLDFL